MGETRDSIADIWGERTPYAGEWPARIDERTTSRPDRWVQSACVLCSNGCGLDIGGRFFVQRFRRVGFSDVFIEIVSQLGELCGHRFTERFGAGRVMAEFRVEDKRLGRKCNFAFDLFGRDADFFLFSANYVGSDSTGYVETKEIEPEVPALDLGTAMAISGGMSPRLAR